MYAPSPFLLPSRIHSFYTYTSVTNNIKGKKVKALQALQAHHEMISTSTATQDPTAEKPHYPAHPGPRSHLHRAPDSEPKVITPVLSRRPSGDQVMIYKRNKEPEKGEGSSSSGTTMGAVGDEKLVDEKLEEEIGRRNVSWAIKGGEGVEGTSPGAEEKQL